MKHSNIHLVHETLSLYICLIIQFYSRTCTQQIDNGNHNHKSSSFLGSVVGCGFGYVKILSFFSLRILCSCISSLLFRTYSIFF